MNRKHRRRPFWMAWYQAKNYGRVCEERLQLSREVARQTDRLNTATTVIDTLLEMLRQRDWELLTTRRDRDRFRQQWEADEHLLCTLSMETGEAAG